MCSVEFLSAVVVTVVILSKSIALSKTKRLILIKLLLLLEIDSDSKSLISLLSRVRFSQTSAKVQWLYSKTYTINGTMKLSGNRTHERRVCDNLKISVDCERPSRESNLQLIGCTSKVHFFANRFCASLAEKWRVTSMI